MKIGIYGAGSLGIVLGAYLTRAGIPVDLINHNEANVAALRQYGARVEGTVSLAALVSAITPQEMRGEYDVLFLLTKQLDNARVAAFLAAQLSATGVVCTLQNGLPEPGLAAVLGENRVLGCTVEWGATLVSPGVSRLTSAPDSLTFGLGSLSPDNPEAVARVRKILEAMCPVIVEENFIGTRWSKLLINTAFSGMSAVLGCTFGEAVADKKSRKCVQRLIKECIDVAHAHGIRFALVQGKDIVKLLDYHGPVKQWISSMIIPVAIKKHRMIKASMLQDLEKGKLTEVDGINGVIAAYGRKAGIPTPYNDRVIDIIHGIEKGLYQPCAANADLFLNSAQPL